jgi:hypothetical protein
MNCWPTVRKSTAPVAPIVDLFRLAISLSLLYVITDARSTLCFMLKVVVFWLLLVVFALASFFSFYTYSVVHFWSMV